MADRLISIVNDYDKALEGLEADAIARMNQAIDDTYKQLINKLNKTYPRLSKIPALLETERAALLVEELGHLLSIINPKDRDVYEEMFRGLLGDSSELGAGMVEELIREVDPQFKVASFTKVPAKAMAIAAKNSYQRLLRHGEVFSDKATNTIIRGLAAGWGNKRIASAIKEATKTTKSNAETIARTESANAAVGAAKSRYKESGIEYVIWTTVITEVCPWCTAKAGKIFRVEDVVIPQHPRCRCGLIPVTPDWARNNVLDFEEIADYSDRARKASEGNQRTDKAPFEARAPRSLSLETLKRKAG